jgi:hypothetical protein
MLDTKLTSQTEPWGLEIMKACSESPEIGFVTSFFIEEDLGTIARVLQRVGGESLFEVYEIIN